MSIHFHRCDNQQHASIIMPMPNNKPKENKQLVQKSRLPAQRMLKGDSIGEEKIAASTHQH